MLVPTQDYILIKPEPRLKSEVLEVITHSEDRATEGAIAEVIAVGPGKPNQRGVVIPLAVSPGERILFGGNGLGGINFPEHEINGVRHLLIQEADICGVVD